MRLKFDFVYTSESEHFEALLRFYARNLNFFIEKSPNLISLTLQGVENQLLEFSKSLETLPNSVFLRDFKVQRLENSLNFKDENSFDKINSNFAKNAENPQDKTPLNLAKNTQNTEISPQKITLNIYKKDFLTSLNANFYLKNGTLKENEFGAFVDMSLSFDDKFYQSIDKSRFTELLNEAFERLKKGGEIYAKNAFGRYKFTLFDAKTPCDFVMATRAEAVKSAFVLNNENLKLLASMEKPLVELKFSAIFCQKFSPNSRTKRVKLPHNLFFFALCERLFSEAVSFLAFVKLENLGDDFEVSECNGRLIVLRGFTYIPKAPKELIFSKSDKNMARISYILSRQNRPKCLVELTCDYEDIILVKNELNLLNLSLPHNANALYKDICEDEVGQKLLENFKQEFPLLQGEFSLKNNFFSLFGLLGRVLGLDSDTQSAANRLLEMADSTKMPRGVKLDFKFKPKTRKFDYARTLRSAMSFMLAGVEAENIALGAVESLVLFLRDIYDEVRQNGLCEGAILSGSLFSHKSVAKNALKHLKNSEFSDVPLYI